MEYAYDNVLASTQWINDHLNDSTVRILEIDYNPSSSYMLGHIPGAVLLDWRKELVDSTKRDIISKERGPSIFVLSKSELGAINSSDILPVESITNAAKMFSSISTRC